MKCKIAIALTSFAEHDFSPLNLLKREGFEVVINPFRRKLNKKETLDLCASCAGIIAGTEKYDSEILERLTGLKVISRCGIGMDNIDLDAAKRLGIKLYNTPDAPTGAVAELTIGLILALLRKITIMDREMHGGVWNKRIGYLLSGKKVGVIGLGRIGRKVAEILNKMGADVFYSDPILKDKQKDPFHRIELKDLLRESDIISLHLSYSEENHKLLGREEFSLMKPGAFLVNCSRGSIVDEEALYSCLKEGKLEGAAIDVFEQEPYHGRLKELDNVILTPHIGSFAKEARIKMESEAARNLMIGLKNQE
jgi:D-3-phosphoglycerate dehydrogenase